MFILCGVSTYASTPSSSLCKTGGHETAIQGFEGNVGKSPRKSQVHLVLIVHVGRIRRKDHERSMACLLGSGTYLECTVADVALRITKALLDWKCFCSGRRSPVNLFNLYATMLRVDVEEKVSVLLVRDTTCLGRARTLRLPKSPWNILNRWPEWNLIKWHFCCPQPSTMILGTCRISSMYSSAESTSNKLASFKSSRQWLCDFQRTILHAVTNWKYPPD